MIVLDEPAGPSATTDEPNEKANEVLLQQLVDMGFPVDGCKRALFKTGNNNAEAAMNWIFEHQSDPDFDAPYQSAMASASAVSDPSTLKSFVHRRFQMDEDSIALVMSMGFSRSHAARALTMTNNNVEAAVDWACSNSEDSATIHSLVESLPQAARSKHSTMSQLSSKLTHFRDGSGKYRLVAFISHIGNQPSCGHYVAHILKDGHWVIFNDETVALSEHPPKDLAYLYLYKRAGN